MELTYIKENYLLLLYRFLILGKRVILIYMME
nr:MAG TPA: hypothetical protein [Caudoviricetes sp.]